MASKPCRYCGAEVLRVKPTGPIPPCPPCRKHHRASVAASGRRRRRAADVERARAKDRARAQAWRQKNPEKESAKTRRYRERHPHRVKAVCKSWYERNRLVCRQSWHRWRARLVDPRSPGVTAEQRREIFALFSGFCAYCNSPATDLDHVIPLSRGGLDEPLNVVPACRSCNCSKGTKLPLEWRPLL